MSLVKGAMNWVFDGIIKWIANVVVCALLDSVTKMVTGMFNVDMGVFNTIFPFFNKTTQIIKAIAFGLLFVICLTQIMKGFFGPLSDGESAIPLLVRGTGAVFGIVFAYDIFDYIMSVITWPLKYINEVDSSVILQDKTDFSFKGMYDSVISHGGQILSDIITDNPLKKLIVSIIAIILVLAIAWNYFKLLLEVIERYIVLGVLYFLGPLGFAMAPAKATVNVFKAYLRMLFSEMFLLIMNGWFIKGFNSAVGAILNPELGVNLNNSLPITGGSKPAFLTTDAAVIVAMMCSLAYLKVCQNMDRYMGQLGLNTAQTGGFLAAEIGLVTKGLKSSADKATNAFTGGKNGMLGAALDKIRGPVSKPENLTADNVKGLAQKNGRFGAFGGGDASKVDNAQKAQIGQLGQMGMNTMNSNKALNKLPEGANHGQVANAMTNGMLNGVIGENTRINSIGGGKFEASGLSTPAGDVSFTARKADGKMAANEFAFMGAGETPMYGRFTGGSVAAQNAAKASMEQTSKNGGDLIFDKGNVFGGSGAAVNGAAAFGGFSSLAGVSGSFTNVKSDGNGGFTGTYIGKDGSMTNMALKPTAANKLQNNNALTNDKGQAFAFSAGDGKAAAALNSEVNKSNANNIQANKGGVNSAMSGKTADGFDSKMAATSLLANAGKDVNTNPVASATFGKSGANIKMADGSSIAMSEKNGVYTATAKDADGNVTGKAQGTDAAAVMQATANPDGFDATKGATSLPDGVSSISKTDNLGDGGFATSSVDDKLNSAEVVNINPVTGEPDGASSLKDGIGAEFTNGKLTEDGMSATMNLGDPENGGTSIPVSFARSFDEDGNANGWNATVGEGDNAATVSAGTLEDASVMAASTGYAMALNEGAIEKGNIPEAASSVLSGDDASAIVGSMAGVDGSQLSNTIIDNNMASTQLDTGNGDYNISGSSLGDVANTVGAINDNDMSGIQAGVDSGVAISGNGFDGMVAEASGLETSNVTASVSEGQMTASYASGTSDEVNVSGGSVQDTASALGSVTAAVQSGDMGAIQSAVDNGINVSGAGFESAVAGVSGLEASSVTASVTDGQMSASYASGTSGEVNVSGGSVQDTASALSDVSAAVQSGDMDAIQSAVDNGINVSGAGFDSAVAGVSGLEASSVTASVTDGQMSASYASGTSGEINVSGGSVQDTASALGSVSAAVQSGDLSTIQSVLSDSASVSGAGVDNALASQSSVYSGSVSDANITNDSVGAKLNTSQGDINISSGNTAEFSGIASAMNSSATDSDYAKTASEVFNGNYGDTGMSGNAVNNAYSNNFGGSNDDKFSNAYVSDGVAGATMTTDDGSSHRLTTTKNTDGTLSTSVETLNSFGEVVSSRAVVSAKAEDVTADVKAALGNTTITASTTRDAAGDINSAHYSKANYQCTNYDNSTGTGSAVIKSSHNGAADNISFEMKNGKAMVTSVNGEKVKRPFEATNLSTEKGMKASKTRGIRSFFKKK